MADPRGFLTQRREPPPRRPVDVRIRDWREVYAEPPPGHTRAQAGRCMDCGVPFCHAGCPLGNLIPEWTDLVRRGDWREAAERLHATNNFPEFTGRLCPAPCESACVLGLADEPVTIEHVEAAIADRAWAEGWVTPYAGPRRQSGRRVAVVGSGPAGLAAAQQLVRAGHAVTVFERDDRLGGLLRYGIPAFKLEKRHLDRRLDQLRAEGVEFVTSCEVGVDLPVERLRSAYDAVVLAAGSTRARELAVPGRELRGVHPAMEYLTAANRVVEGDAAGPAVDAAGKRVVIVGGGDTAADCLGTAHRQGASSVHQLDIRPEPPRTRPAGQPWPLFPAVLRSSAAHEEGGERLFAAATVRFADDGSGAVAGVEVAEAGPDRAPVPGTSVVLDADLVLLALGFTGPDCDPLLADLGVTLDARGRVRHDADWRTGAPGVFVAGDMGRGQSLIVWAIAEGRAAAAAVDRQLRGESALPTPVAPAARPLVV